MLTARTQNGEVRGGLLVSMNLSGLINVPVCCCQQRPMFCFSNRTKRKSPAVIYEERNYGLQGGTNLSDDICRGTYLYIVQIGKQ